ncbi:MAG TPA: DUF2199 domain-containing protein [Gaiellaceae bacterium]|nr:DUF2199 domain-containing protein [Gaiellaceae bacterium]HXV02989.1 DUF2199 domain-containing protein [Gaiellaceae bacterium]
MRWTCSRCGAEHEGVPLDWAFDRPAYWDGARNEGDWISDDLCVWTDDVGERNYFIRGLVEIPIPESGERLAYGVWSSLSKKSFDRVVDLWDDPARTEEPPYFGWLSNSIAGYPETLNLPLDVVTEQLEQRPSFLLHDGDHPLIREQHGGISPDRVLAVAELQLHPD